MKNIIASIRLVIVSMLIVVAGYIALTLAIAKAVAPEKSLGSLITAPDGKIIGSHLIAQKFTKPEYFWPRPSAVDYNAAGAGGSNKSPTSTDLTDRATKTVADFGATDANPLPAELVAASGGGLDPHITEHGALYQAKRVADARHLPVDQVENLVRQQSFAPGGLLTSDRIVNVLELNIALDQLATK